MNVPWSQAFRVWMAIAIGLFAVVPLLPRSVGAESGTWNSQIGVSVSWSGVWFKEAEESVDGDYDMLRIRAGETYFLHEIYGIIGDGSTTDPAVIAHQFIDRFRADLPDRRIKQEWDRGGSSGPLPMIIEYTAKDGAPVTEAVQPRSFNGGTQVYIFTSVRSGNLDPFVLRELDWALSHSFPPDADPFPKSGPAPTPVPTAESRLADALRRAEWTEDERDAFAVQKCGEPELKAGSFVPEGTQGETVMHQVVFDVCGGTVGYLVLPNQAAAQATLDQIIDRMAEINPAVGFPSGEVYPRIGLNSYYFQVVDNVLVGASFADNDASFAETIAYELVEGAVARLVRVQATL